MQLRVEDFSRKRFGNHDALAHEWEKIKTGAEKMLALYPSSQSSNDFADNNVMSQSILERKACASQRTVVAPKNH
ncbi:unnamed protein product [Haemonchus placei]|uniref:MADF domain-containing protein n=1 Tax=Haemonchus placei TaxID=6290 RepID=A0A0N4VSR8_HAEPC|nr:unnamed protein product [Haemonchus placei]